MRKRASNKVSRSKKNIRGGSKSKSKLSKKSSPKKVSQKKTVRKKKEKLSKKDLKLFKDLLLNLRDDMVNQLRELAYDSLGKSQKDISGDISGYSLHMADVATDNYEREFNLGLVSSERRVILEIDEALKRIEEGNYGKCLMCDTLIPIKRLEAIPFARYCIKCQEKKEKEESFNQ